MGTYYNNLIKLINTFKEVFTMTYFNNVKTLDELRKQYKELLKQYHPDNPNGSTEATQTINAEYDKLFKALKDKHEQSTDNTFIRYYN